MYVKSYICHSTVILLIIPNMIDGFLFWPFNSNDRSEDNSWNSVFGSLFPFIKWNRSPVFGINAYKEIDMGDVGEFRNDFVFRIGPKPRPITNGMDERYKDDRYIFEITNDIQDNHNSKRHGRGEFRNFANVLKGLYDDENHDLFDVNQHYIERPEERRSSTR